jgi:hypothetical protein
VGNVVHCVVRDDGSASSHIQAGQGLTIVSHLAGALGGTIQHQFRANGSTSKLVFPLIVKSPLVGAVAVKRARRELPSASIAPPLRRPSRFAEHSPD